MDGDLIALFHNNIKERITLRDALQHEGFQVVVGSTLDAGLDYLKKHPPAAVVVAATPGLDGIEFCRSARADPQLRTLPILVLAASEKGRLEGLEAGADDSLPRPVKLREFLARFRGVLRRATPSLIRSDVLQTGDLIVDLGRFKATFRGKTSSLSAMEMSLLRILATHPDRVIQREDFLRILGKEVIRDGRCIDVHMMHIRQKLGSDLVETVPRRGYRLNAGASGASADREKGAHPLAPSDVPSTNA
jgi:DNA-binding response OmpR family regulator